MASFLHKSASYIQAQVNGDFSGVTIVVPGKRPTLLMLQEFTQMGALNLPKIIPIDAWMRELSGQKAINKQEALFKLYELYYNLQSDAESFENFESFGQLMLKDFDDIDRNMVEARPFFDNLNAFKEIEFWGVEEADFTDFQKRYQSTFKILPQVYAAFKNYYASQDQATDGLAYNIACQRVVSGQIETGQVFFVGLGALSKAESQMIYYLEKSKKAVVVSDVDAFYFDNEQHEAGKIFRTYYQNAFNKKPLFVDHSFAQINKEINEIGLSGKIAQGKWAVKIVKELLDKSPLEMAKTAIVLPNEQLVLPLLLELPYEVGVINATMGLPLSACKGYEWLMLWFNLHLKATQELKNVPGLYAIDKALLLQFLSHALTQTIFNSNNALSSLKSGIFKSSRRAYTAEQLSLQCEPGYNEVLKLLFDGIYKPKNLYERLAKMSYIFAQNTDQIEVEFWTKLNLTMASLKQLSKQYVFLDEVGVLIKLLRRQFEEGVIRLETEENGLQIMGLLETRMLDFENVIILSMNEGIMPKTNFQKSLIPGSIRGQYGLPSNSESDSIYAYHFYRLMQRAQKIWFLYDTNVGKIDTNEVSRYVLQARNEWTSLENVSYTRTQESMPFNAELLDKHPICIDKDEEVMAQLVDFLCNKGLSASTLNTYINCPLQFYLKHVNKIAVRQEAEPELASNVSGTVVHETMKALYLPYKNILLQPIDFEAIKLNIEPVLNNLLTLHFKDGDFDTGRNYLLYHMLINIVRKFVEHDEDLCQSNELVILKLEESAEYRYELIGSEHSILLKGNIDRVDLLNNQLRVIDYKTGSVSIPSFNLENMDAQKLKEGIQLMFYAILLLNNEEFKDQSVQALLYKLKDKVEGYLRVNKSNDISKANTIEALTELGSIFATMLDTSTPIEQTEINNNCMYCDFKTICNVSVKG